MAIQGEVVSKYFVGGEVSIRDCNIVLTQPTVKAIMIAGEDLFLSAVNFISQMSNMLAEVQKEETEVKILSELQLFIALYKQEPKVRYELDALFYMIFPQYKVKVTDNSIDFIQEKIIKGRINPFNFPSFQKVVTELFLPYIAQKEEYNPATEKAKEIAEKLKKGKEKRLQQKNNGKDGDISLFSNYISILAIGMKMDLNIFLNYTPFQLYDTFMRYNKKEAYERYWDISTIPFSDTSSLEAPDEWTSNLYSNN